VSTVLRASLVSEASCRVDPATMLAAFGLTEILATGAGVTLNAALPVFPSLAATIFAVPTDSAVTSPDEDTVATAVLSELHVTVRPVSAPPTASWVVAAAWAVPTAVTAFGSSATVTDATGTWVMVIVAELLFPSLVAVIVAVPGATAATRPDEETVATPSSLEVQVTRRPVRTLLPASLTSAASCWVDPASTVAVAGLTVIEATGAEVTVTDALPLLSSLVAMMFAVPALTAVTSPVPETVATELLSELQVTARPASTPPLPSSVVAVACVVSTAVIEVAARATVTDATGTGVTVIEELALCPSLVAVIVAFPWVSAFTRPDSETVAIAGALEVQVTARPLNRLLWASRSVTVSCSVIPAVTVPDAGVTDTATTGAGVTVRVALPLFPSLAAVILTTPVLTADTNPAGETVATAVLSELHVTGRPVSTPPLPSSVIAVAWVVSIALMELAASATVTDATGIAVTVIEDVPLFPSLAAVIVATPGTTAVTRPVLDTAATAGSLDDQLTERPTRMLLLASSISADSCCVAPVTTLVVAGVTVTDATGISFTVSVAVPLAPSLAAVISVVPGATVVTNPLVGSTVATAALLELQATVRPSRTLPPRSLSIAAAWLACPTKTVAGETVTVTEETGTGVRTA
jgi:hypothetical protein